MGTCVLFVVDEPENLAVFEACCADWFSVLTASSAGDALEIMRAHDVAVLLADQRMPEMTGLELLERARLEFPDTVRMLITAYSDLNAAIEAINSGSVRRYLRKPWDADELHAALKEAIEFYNMTVSLRVLERRLEESERVYSLGVVAAGLGRQLRGPLGTIEASLLKMRESLGEIGPLLEPHGRSILLLRARIGELEDEIVEAMLGVRRSLDVVRGIELPTDDGSAEICDVSEVLRLALRLVQTDLRGSASLELDVRQAPPVAASPAKVGQVVLNLLVNSLRAVKSQRAGARKLSIRLLPEDDCERLELADSGPSISSEAFPRVLEPRIASALGDEHLALTTSRTILTEIGGQIEVQNTADGGRLFRVRLPVLRRISSEVRLSTKEDVRLSPDAEPASATSSLPNPQIVLNPRTKVPA